MKFCVELPPILFSALFADYVWKPLFSALWVLSVGYVATACSNYKRRRDVKRICKHVYSSHKEVIQQLRNNINKLNDGSYTILFPEIDKGGNLVKSIESVPKWAPFSKFSDDTYYLVGALKDYQQTRLLIAKTIEDSDMVKEKHCKLALNFACNAYLKMLSISDPFTYNAEGIAEHVKNDIGYAIKYFNVE